MKLFLAGLTSFLGKPLTSELVKDVYVLESFYYANQKTEQYIPLFKDFLLDSGAFTFFSSGKQVDWDDYVKRYSAFIVKNNIKHFFELDIDKLVGYPKVLDLRKKLETMTGRKCIPVWHKSRGKEELCKGYTRCIETNGTNKVPSWIDWITCSPKSDIDFKAIGRMPDEIKVVCEYGREKYLESLIGLGPKLYLQPLEQNGKMNVAEVFDFIKQHPEYRLSLQFHKLLGIR